jgi:predicted deacetylase
MNPKSAIHDTETASCHAPDRVGRANMSPGAGASVKGAREQNVSAARYLCVSLHDVAPATWRSCRQVLAAVHEVADIPLTLLVVPAYCGQCSAMVPGFEAAMTDQLTQGHELALHGYFHRDLGMPCSALDWLRRRVYTVGEGEFSALTEREAAERLLLGQRWFRANRWPLSGFVAPAWLLGQESWKAVRRTPDLEYVTTFTHIHALHTGESLRAPCLTLSARAPWHRAVSRAWAGMAWRRSQAPLMRLALHPRDAAYPALRRTWQNRLADLLAEREAVRKVDFVHTAFALDPACWTTDVAPGTERPKGSYADAWFAKTAANLAASP